MSNTIRHSRLLLAGAAALAPLVAMQADAADAVVSGARAYVPASPNMVLTRTVSRGLPGGAALTAKRTYALQFTAEGAGFRVEAQQVGCAVDAPRALARLAAMEQARVDTGAFPLQLDNQGKISLRSAESRKSADAGLPSAIAKSPLAPAEKSTATQFVSTMAERGGAPAAWPRDLFAAQVEQRNETKRIALPDGGEGSVTVTIRANDASGGVREVERVIVTTVDGDRRETRETWTLRPA